VAARSKAWVYVRSPADIVGSNPTGGMDVCHEYCVLSGRGLCDELITSPEDSYRLCCVVVCDLETSWMRRPWPTGGGTLAPKTKDKHEVTAVNAVYNESLVNICTTIRTLIFVSSLNAVYKIDLKVTNISYFRWLLL